MVFSTEFLWFKKILLNFLFNKWFKNFFNMFYSNYIWCCYLIELDFFSVFGIGFLEYFMVVCFSIFILVKYNLFGKILIVNNR